jgi:phage-related protein
MHVQQYVFADVLIPGVLQVLHEQLIRRGQQVVQHVMQVVQHVMQVVQHVMQVVQHVMVLHEQVMHVVLLLLMSSHDILWIRRRLGYHAQNVRWKHVRQ